MGHFVLQEMALVYRLELTFTAAVELACVLTHMAIQIAYKEIRNI